MRTKGMKKFIIGLLMAAMLIGGVNGFNSDNNGGALPVEKQQTVQEDTGSIQKAFAAGKSTMKVHYIDVGQGSAVLVQSGSHFMLVDGGDRDALFQGGQLSETPEGQEVRLCGGESL